MAVQKFRNAALRLDPGDPGQVPDPGARRLEADPVDAYGTGGPVAENPPSADDRETQRLEASPAYIADGPTQAERNGTIHRLTHRVPRANARRAGLSRAVNP